MAVLTSVPSCLLPTTLVPLLSPLQPQELPCSFSLPLGFCTNWTQVALLSAVYGTGSPSAFTSWYISFLSWMKSIPFQNLLRLDRHLLFIPFLR